MSDGRHLVYGLAEVGTHHAFVNLLARLSWAMKDVGEYTLRVVSVDAGVCLHVTAWVPPELAQGVADAAAEAGVSVTYHPDQVCQV